MERNLYSSFLFYHYFLLVLLLTEKILVCIYVYTEIARYYLGFVAE